MAGEVVGRACTPLLSSHHSWHAVHMSPAVFYSSAWLGVAFKPILHPCTTRSPPQAQEAIIRKLQQRHESEKAAREKAQYALGERTQVSPERGRGSGSWGSGIH